MKSFDFDDWWFDGESAYILNYWSVMLYEN